MPRLPPPLLRRAAARNRHLPRLLLECRDLHSAENELRWLTEFAHDGHTISSSLHGKSPRQRLSSYVARRSKGEPLQYILGTQPFGNLEILCRPGVLIPRNETETYTTTLAKLIVSAYGDGYLGRANGLAVADLCTGTGCITLLLHHLIAQAAISRPVSCMPNQMPRLRLLGADISFLATELAKRNLQHNITAQLLHKNANDDVEFCQLDVLALGRNAARQVQLNSLSSTSLQAPIGLIQSSQFLVKDWPIIVSNPPYISPDDFAPGGTTAKSVREYEPMLALVPPAPSLQVGQMIVPPLYQVHRADTFYEALLYIARAVRTELLVMEIGESTQAYRVVELARRILQGSQPGNNAAKQPIVLEIWDDDGAVETCGTDIPMPVCTDLSPNEPGARAVVVWRGDVASWRYTNRREM